MCGRYTLKSPIHILAEEFGITGPLPEVRPSYNVAPGRNVAAVLDGGDGGRRLEVLKWGLVPSWAKDPGIGNRMINARSETAAEKPSFRKAMKERRCLILADGFYEWRKMGNGKQPYHARMADGRPFAFAGLWERWERDGEELRTCAILTTGANDLMRPVHDRMPVILPREEYEMWLDPELRDPAPLLPLLAPYPSEAMTVYPVSRAVNRPSNDGPACVEPAA